MHRSPLTRIAAALAVLAVVFTLAVPAPASAVMSPLAIPDFVFNGGGWGHGIGMSQYGAQGYALKGWTAEQIIKHYFQGSYLGTNTGKRIRVRLDPDAGTDSAEYTRQTWRIRPGYQGGKLKINGVEYTDGTYTFTASGSSIVVSGGSIGSPKTLTGEVRVDPVGGNPPLLQVVEGTGLYKSWYVRHRGFIRMNASSSRIRLIGDLAMEDYVKGVIPRESPARWQPAALQAQAIAARSYAYASSTVYCTTKSQAYGGHSKGSDRTDPDYSTGEHSNTNAAADATANRYAMYDGAVITTFFSSSMGGHTANIEDSWSYSAPKPYYTGVPSPYEALAGCPNQSWTVAMSGLELAAKLKGSSSVTKELADYGLAPVPVGAGSSVSVSSISVDYGVSGYPRWVYFKFSTGDTVKLSAWTVKVALELKSPNFRPTTFPISRVEGGDRYATSVEICNAAFPGGTAPAVVLASGQDYADALTGSALAGAAGGPLLLMAKDHLPDSVAREVRSLAPSTIYIMGGTAAVSSAVEDSVRSLLPSARIVRLSGANRFDTSVLAAREVQSLSGVTKAIVVSGSAWADGAAISGLAYAKRYPILLTATDNVPGSVSAFFAEAKPASTLIAGGAAVVTGAVATTISDLTGGGVTRLSGADRYYTSSAIARHSVDVEGFGYGQVYLATGAMYADALSGGVLAGVTEQPILLTGIDSCPDGTQAFLRERKAGIAGLTIFGGPSAVSIDGLLALNEAMR